MAVTASPHDPLIALTMGDPAGIGPDVTLAAWASRESFGLPPFIVLGDPGLYLERAACLGLEAPVETVTDIAGASRVFPAALPVLPIPLAKPVRPGKPDAGAATAIVRSIETGVELMYRGEVAALVTNPINKKLLYASGFEHPGHTEFLAALARRHGDEATEPVMMLVCDELRVVPATIHIPLKAVPRALTRGLLERTIRTTAGALTGLFGIARPHIAVTGLNPHAGEEGTLGAEEIEIIAPALEELRAAGISVTGPFPADTLFQERLRATYDAVVTMYHDQALIPVKTLAFDRAVNLTIGLPFIRTSPDHGTAYDLAGTGKADPRSLIEAIRLAARLSARQRAAA